MHRLQAVRGGELVEGSVVEESWYTCCSAAPQLQQIQRPTKAWPRQAAHCTGRGATQL
jgi:hypothetical protein